MLVLKLIHVSKRGFWGIVMVSYWRLKAKISWHRGRNPLKIMGYLKRKVTFLIHWIFHLTCQPIDIAKDRMQLQSTATTEGRQTFLFILIIFNIMNYITDFTISPQLEGHDDVIKWKHFSHCWPFVRESTGHKGHWRGAMMFSLMCAWTNSGVASYLI